LHIDVRIKFKGMLRCTCDWIFNEALMKLKVPRVVELEIVAFWVMRLYKGFSE